jgi:hypothetical protein
MDAVIDAHRMRQQAIHDDSQRLHRRGVQPGRSGGFQRLFPTSFSASTVGKIRFRDWISSKSTRCRTSGILFPPAAWSIIHALPARRKKRKAFFPQAEIIL